MKLHALRTEPTSISIAYNKLISSRSECFKMKIAFMGYVYAFITYTINMELDRHSYIPFWNLLPSQQHIVSVQYSTAVITYQ